MPEASYGLGENGRPLIEVVVGDSDQLRLAMLDTGSERGGLIDSDLASRLGLVAHPEKLGIRTASGVEFVETYEVNVRIPALGTEYLVELASADLMGAEFDIALGTDFLSNFTIVYEGRQKLLTLSDD